MRRPLFALLLIITAAPATHALTLLTTGKVAVFRSPGDGTASARVRVGRDRALVAPPSPLCPTTSSLRFALTRRAADFEDHGEIALPCEMWKAKGKGFRYQDDAGVAGGVREILVGPRGLRVLASGAGYDPVAGPVAYVEAWLTIGSEKLLVRFQSFGRNDTIRIVTRPPSGLAAAGEAAFWDTLWADAPRSDDALRLLEKAVRRNPRDGRSQFLLGMLHLYRTGPDPTTFDFANLSPAQIAEGEAAQAPLDRAVELLPHDSRVAGFRAAATYANGFAQGDVARRDLGLMRLDESIAANPLFNSFDLFAVVPPTIAGGSDFYQNRVLPLIDFIFSDDNLSCPVTLPEICNNGGMAPHNLEGSLILMGDILAKGGRLAAPPGSVAGAQTFYSLAQGVGRGNGYRYQAIADERVQTAAERVARHQDADPTNDPVILGGAGASCVYCHNK